MKKLIIKSCIVLLIAGVVLGYATKSKATVSGQLGQMPEPGQNASFLTVESSLKIVRSGTVVIPEVTSPGSVSASITHNLGYPPVVIAYATSGDGSIDQLPFTTGAITGTDPIRILTNVKFFSTRTSVTFTASNANNPSTTYGPLSVKYFLLQNIAD